MKHLTRQGFCENSSAGERQGRIVLREIRLGKTNIRTSRLGIGSGTADHLGRCSQAMMPLRTFSDLLVYACEKGITLWDTALLYNTHRHIRHALTQVSRRRITLVSKIPSIGEKSAYADVARALEELDVDYLDVCLLHGVRNERDFRSREGALKALIAMKKSGMIRSVGLSAHGIEALEAARESSEIEVVWARVNYAGYHMDTRRLGVYDSLAAFAFLKKMVKLLPRGIIAPLIHRKPTPVSEADRTEVAQILKQIHGRGIGVVGMKVVGEGLLADNPRRALEYVNGLSCVDAAVVGMVTREQITANISAIR